MKQTLDKAEYIDYNISIGDKLWIRNLQYAKQ